MARYWLSELLLLAGLLAVGFLAGVLTGSPGWMVAAALAIFLLRWVWNVFRLESWLRSRRLYPPYALGLWGHIFDEYYRLRRRQYKSKKRLARVIREFRESTAAMPDGTLVLDEDFRIMWCNEAACRFLGLTDRRDLGQTIGNLVRSPRFHEYLHSGHYEQPFEMRSPVDETRTLSLRLVPYGIKQYLLLVRDITRLQRLQAMRREFVANASHELRSPLTVLVGYLDSLSDDADLGSEWRKPLAEMRAQCTRMSNLVNDLLELSRLETEELDAPFDQWVDLAELAARVVDAVQMADPGMHDIVVDVADGVAIAGVEGELYSALSNLVTNAIRYSPGGSRIDIVIWRGQDGSGVVEVRDQGIGIEASHIPFITQRFYRVDSSHSRKTGGTGLGLAIVKHVLKRHAANLEIESETGEGSTFRCVFPHLRVRSATGNVKRKP